MKFLSVYLPEQKVILCQSKLCDTEHQVCEDIIDQMWNNQCSINYPFDKTKLKTVKEIKNYTVNGLEYYFDFLHFLLYEIDSTIPYALQVLQKKKKKKKISWFL
jgi:hypothetical protein